MNKIKTKIVVIFAFLCFICSACFFTTDTLAQTIKIGDKPYHSITVEGVLKENKKGYYFKFTKPVYIKYRNFKSKEKKLRVKGTDAEISELEKYKNINIKIKASLSGDDYWYYICKIKKITTLGGKTKESSESRKVMDESTETPRGSNNKNVKNTVKASYIDGAFGKKKIFDWEVEYSDDYFSGKANEVNKKTQGKIAKLSMLASASVYNADCGKAFMQDKLKFEKVNYVTHKTSKTNYDHSNYMIGYKNIDDFTLVAVWIRGSVGELTELPPDWKSNFNIGRRTVHEGFGNAEKEMSKEVKQYITKLKSDNKCKKTIKLWITGHSRGAAIANLFGSRMTNEYGKEQVFAYTFASPYVSKKGNNKNKQYSNIVNYINPGDVVAAIPPQRGSASASTVLNIAEAVRSCYKRYGKDILFADKYTEMSKIFKEKTGKKFEGNHTKKVIGDFNESYTGENTGYENIGSIFAKMIDHEIKKIGHAHCQSLYLSWLEAIYE